MRMNKQLHDLEKKSVVGDVENLKLKWMLVMQI